MDSLNKIAHKEFRAFHYPEYFLKDILECYDWLYPWQKETFLEFYRNDYKELVACVGQRCLHPDTKVLTSDGSYKKVKNIDDGEILYGMDFESGKIRTDNCLIHENEEEKEIVELEVWTGKKIKLSHDHKVFTQRGLVEASDLKEDEDYVYIPYETDNGYVSDPHQAKILGYIIGDGTFRHTVGFSQKDEDVIKDFEKSLEKRYNCELKYTSGYDYYIVGKEKRKNKLLEEVRKLGLWMKDSHTKFIPDIVFRYDKESLIEFLRAYFKCDGTVSKDGLSVSLSSVSGRLLRDTSKLLLKLGIRSNIDYTTHKHGFRLKINDKKRFKELIGDFRDNKIKETYNNNSSPIDRLPFKCTDIGIYRNDVRYLGKDSIRLSNEHHLSNEHLRKLDELDLDKHNIPKKLNPIIEEECFFDKVVSVENVGKGKTYDITMPNIGNFFAEDILVKNSGKTLLSSLIATYELFKLLAVKKPNTYYNMPKGSDYHIMCIATNQQQSKDTVFSEIESRIDNCEWFQKQNFKKRTLDYEFKTDENSIHIRAEHSNSASLAGHTSKCLTGENRIITDSGYKKIKDINENEEIQDIELERVNNKFDNGISEVVELKTSKGYTLECTPDHEIIAFRAIEKEELGYGETHNYEIEFIEAQEL
ncbi:MAG: LAGLIDADG family homing endonuclease, partial [Promethearchaeota archaeon]